MRHYFFFSVILLAGGLISSGLVEIYFRYQENLEQLTANAARCCGKRLLKD